MTPKQEILNHLGWNQLLLVFYPTGTDSATRQEGKKSVNNLRASLWLSKLSLIINNLFLFICVAAIRHQCRLKVTTEHFYRETETADLEEERNKLALVCQCVQLTILTSRWSSNRDKKHHSSSLLNNKNHQVQSRSKHPTETSHLFTQICSEWEYWRKSPLKVK